MSKTNVYYIIVDSVSRRTYDLIKESFHDNLKQLDVVPLIEQSKKSKMFVTGCPTEFSYPSLTTSTYPLDFNGYFKGISGRNQSISTIFKSRGYLTYLYNEDFRQDGSGYFHGYVYRRDFYSPARYIDHMTWMLEFYSKIYENESSRQLSLLRARAYLKNTLKDLRKRISSDEWRLLFRISKAESQVIDQFLAEFLMKINVSSSCSFDCFLKNTYKLSHLTRNKKFRPLFIRHYFRVIVYTITSLLRLLKKQKYFKFRRELSGLYWLLKRTFWLGFNFPSSEYTLNKVSDDLVKYGAESNNFFWVHLSDVHENNPLCFKSTFSHNYFSSIKNKNPYIKIYKNSLMSSFSTIVDFIKKIKSTEVLSGVMSDRNIFIITADHGSTKSGCEAVNNLNIARDFHEELYEVPFEVFTDSKSLVRSKYKMVNGLYSSVDILPTIMDFLSFDNSYEMRGTSIYNQPNHGRTYAIAEHNGPGPGDMSFKDIYLWVTNGEYSLSAIANKSCINFYGEEHSKDYMYDVLRERFLEILNQNS
jgi:hypothetical protein